MDLIIAFTLYLIWRTRSYWIGDQDPHWSRLSVQAWPEDHFIHGYAIDQASGKHYCLKSYDLSQESEIQGNFESYGKCSGLWPVRSLQHQGQQYLLFEEHPGLCLNVLIRELRSHQANITLDLAFKIMVEITRKWGSMENTPFWGRAFAPHLVYFGPTGTYFNMWGWPISHQSLQQLPHHSVALYLPPEIRTGTAHPGSSSDIFSLGAIFYELLVLAPWDQNHATLSLLEGKVIPPSSIRTGLSSRIDQFIFKCLHFDPSDRFENYYSFMQFLENLADREAPNWREIDLESILGQFGPQFWGQWTGHAPGHDEEDESIPVPYKKAA